VVLVVIAIGSRKMQSNLAVAESSGAAISAAYHLSAGFRGESESLRPLQWGVVSSQQQNNDTMTKKTRIRYIFGESKGTTIS